MILTCVKLTEHIRSKVPRVVVENCLEILDKLLNDSLLNNSIIILGVLTDHDRSLGICPKGCYETSLQRGPDLVGEEEDGRLDGEHEGDPLVVRSIRSIISTLHTIQVYYALQVGLGLGADVCCVVVGMRYYLVLRGYVGAAMDPAVVLGQVRADALELTTKRHYLENFEISFIYFCIIHLFNLSSLISI